MVGFRWSLYSQAKAGFPQKRHAQIFLLVFGVSLDLLRRMGARSRRPGAGVKQGVGPAQNDLHLCSVWISVSAHQTGRQKRVPTWMGVFGFFVGTDVEVGFKGRQAKKTTNTFGGSSILGQPRFFP